MLFKKILANSVSFLCKKPKIEKRVADEPIIYLDDKLPTALVIVDMQKHFFDRYQKAGIYRRITNLVKELRKLIKVANELDLPIIFIEHRFTKPMCRNQNKIYFEVRQPTTPALFELAKNRYLIERNHDNGFLHTYRDECSGLEPLLEKLKARSVIMAGTNSYCCVYCTAETARFRGYSLITAHDIMALDRDLFPQRKYYESGDLKATYFDNCDKLITSLRCSKESL